MTKFTYERKATQEVTYGPSISTSGHNEWRRHRRIVGPSFSESNNALVWESTIEIVLGYFIKWNRDGKGNVVKVSDFTEVTKQIAFMVFSTAGAYAIWPLSCLTQKDFRFRYQCGLGLGQERNSQRSHYDIYECISYRHTKSALSLHISEMAPPFQ